MTRAPSFARLCVAAVFIGAVVGCDAHDNDRNDRPRNVVVNVDEPDRQPTEAE